MAMRPNMEPDRTDRPSVRPRMTRRAGGVQDSGQGAREPQPYRGPSGAGALTARGGTGYNAPIPSPRQRSSSNEMLDIPPRPSRFPRQDESPRAQNFARILFGPGALQSRGGSGYQGLDTDAMKNAAWAMALQSALSEEPRVRDMPGMTTEEMAPYNRPADDINDAFFGPNRERFDIIDFLMNRPPGGKR